MKRKLQVKRYRLEGRSVSDTAALFMPDVVVDASDYDRLEQERAEQWRLRRDAQADRDTANAVAAELRAQVEAMRKAALELRRFAGCNDVHHDRADQHEYNEPCKVLARIDAALQAKP